MSRPPAQPPDRTLTEIVEFTRRLHQDDFTTPTTAFDGAPDPVDPTDGEALERFLLAELERATGAFFGPTDRRMSDVAGTVRSLHPALTWYAGTTTGIAPAVGIITREAEDVVVIDSTYGPGLAPYFRGLLPRPRPGQGSTREGRR